MTVPMISDASGPILDLHGIEIGYGSAPSVLKGVDLTVRRGEFVTVIGPSGCGKSTILNVVAGLMRVRSGRVLFDGNPVSGINRAVGYMTQGDTLLPWRNVYENVALPLRMQKVPRVAIRPKVESMLELLDLDGAAHKFPSQLSGGMKRRALLGRSMIYDPAMLLMDEPLAALDAQLRAQMHQELLRTVHRLNQTVLFVTHDIFEAVLLSDRVIVLGGSPACPVASFDIPFGADRDLATLRFDTRFVELERRVHEALNAARSQPHVTPVRSS